MKPWICLLLLGLAGTAEARPHYRRVYVTPPRPTVVVRINPWDFRYVPEARPGWHWVPGHETRWGRWVPGYWEPDGLRAGYLWVPGHWAGGMYVDGYWREAGRSGWVWVEGEYDDVGNWVPGYWAPEGTVPPSDEAAPPEPPSDVHHDYEP